MILLGVASHLANMPSITIYKQKMFEGLKMVNIFIYTDDLNEDASEFIACNERLHDLRCESYGIDYTMFQMTDLIYQAVMEKLY